MDQSNAAQSPKRSEAARKKVYNSSINGRASHAWNAIKARSMNSRGDLPTYANVENRLNRDEFIQWYFREVAEWIKNNSGERPSVDRIDNSGHYEFGNIRIISIRDNARAENSESRRRLHSKPGESWCSDCKEYFSVGAFYKNRSTMNGLDSICKRCSSKRSTERSRRK